MKFAFQPIPWLLAGALVFCRQGSAHSQDVAAEVPAGYVVSVAQEKITEVYLRLPALVETPWKNFDTMRREKGDPNAVFTLICDFNPDGQPNRSDSFGACLDLAERLREMKRKHGMLVIAYVHGEVARHSVLAVLACDQIVMAETEEAKLGPVVGEGERLDAFKRDVYEQAVSNRYPPVLIRKMYDRELAVLKVRPSVREGERYRDASEMPRPDGDPVTWLGRGQLASYSFSQAKEVGLIQPEPRNQLDDVLTAYGLPRSALLSSPRKLVVCRTILSGEINGEMKEILSRRIRDAKGAGASVLILQLECAGGQSDKAHEIALMLIELGKPGEERIETVAYLTPSARNLAAFLALACDRIYMHQDALLGDFEAYMEAHARKEELIRTNLSEVASQKLYPGVLARGMLDRDLRIRWASSIRGDSEKRFLEDTEYLAANQPEPRWRTEEMIKPENEDQVGKYLTLTAERAKRLGIAQGVVENVEGVYQQLGVEAKDVQTIGSDFLERIAMFLRDPYTSVVLILLGITCLILELKMPGFGVPGIIAAVCFILYFWSHSQFHGEMTWLALFLFLLGLLLLAVEIFVIPGFGVVGAAGILLVLGGLGLMAFGHWPRNDEEWYAFGGRIAALILGMFGAIVFAVILFRYLPSMPYANRLMLNPREDDLDEEVGSDLDEPPFAQLLGAIGTSATPLRPAGKSQFGEEYLDVVAEGGFIQAGTRVQIVEIEGNRIVVKEV